MKPSVITFIAAMAVASSIGVVLSIASSTLGSPIINNVIFPFVSAAVGAVLLKIGRGNSLATFIGVYLLANAAWNVVRTVSESVATLVAAVVRPPDLLLWALRVLLVLGLTAVALVLAKRNARA